LAGQTSPGCDGDVLGGLDLAQQFAGVAADAVVMDLAQLDLALGVDHEGAAQRQALVLDHHVEVAGDAAGGVADQRGSAILPIASDVSCQALCAKWVSVDTP
jgi:hypothetical protein